jgi:AcrR family transcriptional regulator
MPKMRTPKQSLNDKVAAFKRESILDAAQAVFAERGYHRTTIKDIAAHAGVADGTVYNYFDSKDALLSALFDRFQSGGAMEPGQSPSAQLQKSLGPDMLELVRVMLSEMLVDAALRERYRERFLAPIDALSTGPSADPLAGRASAATVLGLTLLHLLGDPVVTQHWDRMPETLLALAARG